jgi:hypothetical protein
LGLSKLLSMACTHTRPNRTFDLAAAPPGFACKVLIPATAGKSRRHSESSRTWPTRDQGRHAHGRQCRQQQVRYASLWPRPRHRASHGSCRG